MQVDAAVMIVVSVVKSHQALSLKRGFQYSRAYPRFWDTREGACMSIKEFERTAQRLREEHESYPNGGDSGNAFVAPPLNSTFDGHRSAPKEGAIVP
jgi:hypothetical protein